jgi:SAM-dependent methyltransferase
VRCRHCQAVLRDTFVDLGFAPPANAYLGAADLLRAEQYFPLKVMVCSSCWLVQTLDYQTPEQLFTHDYAYFSSTSTEWLTHAAAYAAQVRERLQLSGTSLVIEIGANDGYLLRNFVAAGIPCLGIEPTASTAAVAESRGIPVLREFFGEPLAESLAASGRQADLIVGNNVYAHVPDINDFTRGIRRLLQPDGCVTLEFPHLLRLIESTQFDTIYHEHYSYLSLSVVDRIFRDNGLRVSDVEELPTHGGSLRVYGCHAAAAVAATPAVAALLAAEQRFGLQAMATYQRFQPRVDQIKNDLLEFLLQQKQRGRMVAAYGAAAKGVTLLNYAGVRPDLLPFVCDAATAKQGKFLPGSHIPIHPPALLDERRPDCLLILPRNIAAEIRTQLAHLARLGTEFVIAVPRLEFS